MIAMTMMATLAATVMAAAPAAPPEVPRDSLYAVDATWTDQAGNAVKLSSFAGKPVVLAMFYTRCRAVCPLTISDMKAIERAVDDAARAKARFVLVSFDPEHDSAETLARLAEQHALDPARWTLLTGKQDDVDDLVAILGVKLRAAGAEFAHSSVISILDGRGVIRAQSQGVRQDPAANARLLETLAAEPAPPRSR